MTGAQTGRVVLNGADIELANFILADRPMENSSRRASRLLLDAMPGLVARSRWTGAGSWGASEGEDPQDWGRKFLAENGGCTYIDLDHLEVALPECRSAADHVAAWHAMLRLVEAARRRAALALDDGQRLCVLANNSDGQGHAYGSHLNFLITRRTFHDIFSRKIQPMLVLAAYQASSIVFAGAGKVGSEIPDQPARYQLSQRADFVETVLGFQTTHHRPLVNSRDEPLCGRVGSGEEPGRRDDLARLHVICYDSTLAQVATFLKVGVYQLVLAQMEAGETARGAILEDPVAAIRLWSRDPDLLARARTVSGQNLTAVEHQLGFLEAASRFAACGGFDGTVPDWERILTLWEDTLTRLAARDFDVLARRLDWVLKKQILERALDLHSTLDWTSLQLKQLDHLYSSVDPETGLYWRYERDGGIERVVPEERIEERMRTAPEDTRAWTRAALLDLAARCDLDLEEVNWDYLRFGLTDGMGWYPRSIVLPDPLGGTRQEVEPIIKGARGEAARGEGARELEDVFRSIDALNLTSDYSEEAQ